MESLYGILIFAAFTAIGVFTPSHEGSSGKDISGIGGGSEMIDLMDGLETTAPVEVGEIPFEDLPLNDYEVEKDDFSLESDLPRPSFQTVIPVEIVDIRSPFGNRIHPITKKKKFHEGIDLDGKSGDPILAAAEGVVTFSGIKNGFGEVITIRHEEGWETQYAHLQKRFVNLGDKVRRGKKIGNMGDSGDTTGVHLHFEVLYEKKPVNPEIFLDLGKTFN